MKKLLTTLLLIIITSTYSQNEFIYNSLNYPKPTKEYVFKVNEKIFASYPRLKQIETLKQILVDLNNEFENLKSEIEILYRYKNRLNSYLEKDDSMNGYKPLTNEEIIYLKSVYEKTILRIEKANYRRAAVNNKWFEMNERLEGIN